MAEQPHDHPENPLEELAARLSGRLARKPVDLHEKSATHVEGGQISMKESAARSIRASALHMEDSAAGYVRAGSVDAGESMIGVAVAGNATLRDVTNSALVARHVEADHVRTVFLAAGRVEGRISTFFTPWTAFAAGAGLGVTLLSGKSLLARLFSLIFKRRNA